jgi:hypothetical protein
MEQHEGNPVTDIDLTPMNEAAARALFAEQYAERFINAQDDLTVEQLAHTRIEVRQSALAAWDSGLVPHESMIEYRELALAATLVNWKSIAAQALRKVAADLGPQGLADEHMLHEAAAEYEAAQ